MRDEIVEEVRKIRDQYAAQFNYDLDELFKDIKRLEKESKVPIVNLQPKRIVKAGKKSPRPI
jgi:uncharacterized coiled-coil DUF342 family protein